MRFLTKTDSFGAWDIDRMYNLPLKENKYKKWIKKLMKKTQSIRDNPKLIGIDISKYREIRPVLITDRPIFINETNIPSDLKIMTWEGFREKKDLNV